MLLSWLYSQSWGSLLVFSLFHASVDVALTSNTSSPILITAAGARLTIWGVAVVMRAGPRRLASFVFAREHTS